MKKYIGSDEMRNNLLLNLNYRPQYVHGFFFFRKTQECCKENSEISVQKCYIKLDTA